MTLLVASLAVVIFVIICSLLVFSNPISTISLTKIINYYMKTSSTLQNFSNAILEKSSFGKVVFLENLNFSLIGGENAIVDFDSYFEISNNLIYSDSEFASYRF